MTTAFAPGLGSVQFRKSRARFSPSRSEDARPFQPRAAAPRTPARAVTMARSSFDYESAEIKAGAAAEATTAADGDLVSTAWTPAGTDVAKAANVRKQMEFWFSPSNLKRDWFLRRQMDDDGWLDPAIFLKFNRLKQLNVSLPEVIDACKGSDKLEVSAPPADGSSFGDNLGQTRVRRSVELPAVSDELEAEAERSIVVEGVPADMWTTQLRQLFSRYGEVTYSWISKPTVKDPAKYCIISFKDTRTAVEALESFESDRPEAAPPEVTVKSKVFWDAIQSRQRNKSVVIRLSGLEGDMEWREVWDDITQSVREENLQLVYFLYKNGDPNCYITVADEAAADVFLNTVCNDSLMNVCGIYVKPHVLSTDAELDAYWEMAAFQILERKKRKERIARAQSSPSGGGDTPGNPEGVIVKIWDLPVVGWQELMAAVKELGDVVFLSFQKEAEFCFVRFVDADVAAQAVELLTGPKRQMLLDSEVDASVLEGEEEEEYWKRAQERRRKRMQSYRYNNARHNGDAE